MFSEWVAFLISFLDFVGLTTRAEGPHSNMGHTCGEPIEIELIIPVLTD